MRSCCIALLVFFITNSLYAQKIYEMSAGDIKTEWVSFENPTGEKEKAAQSNNGAKGSAWKKIKPAEKVTLLNIKGSGTIQRIWATVNSRTRETLRSIKIEMFWDGEKTPAVSVPFGDFFGVGLGRVVPFESALFSSPEGRSFNCYIPMPFKSAARIMLTNESKKEVTFFYDINLTREKHDQLLYFHAYWSRNENVLGKDFEILPKVTGRGKFLGCNLGIITDTSYGTTWWGEGEVKMYLDGDSKYPSLAGTGTEDYIGTGYGQGTYMHQYQGCTIADKEKGYWAFYRYHIPDPVYFYKDCNVTIQQIGGAPRDSVIKIYNAGAKLIPVSVGGNNLFDRKDFPKLTHPDFPKEWTNFFRLDNYSAITYFYLDKPCNNLPPLASVQTRLEGLIEKK